MFISDPDKFPITKVEWSGKNSTAVNDVLTKIRTSNNLELDPNSGKFCIFY